VTRVEVWFNLFLMSFPRLPIIFEDDHLVAVYKPAGIHVHPTDLERGRASVMSRLKAQSGRFVYPIHRLDRATSGLVLFAWDKETARVLGQAFAERSVNKEYRALVRGWTEDQGLIETPVKAKDQTSYQEAATRYQTLERIELPQAVGRYQTARYSLVSLFPETGRRHQLRLHLAKINHPIVGDRQYGDGHHNRYLKDSWNWRRLGLWAVGLNLNHPVSGAPLALKTALDKETIRFLTNLGLDKAV